MLRWPRICGYWKQAVPGIAVCSSLGAPRFGVRRFGVRRFGVRRFEVRRFGVRRLYSEFIGFCPLVFFPQARRIFCNTTLRRKIW